jgi:hypothetical protein
LTENCWMCASTDRWYTDETDYVEIEGEKYHPENVPAQNETTTEGESE